MRERQRALARFCLRLRTWASRAGPIVGVGQHTWTMETSSRTSARERRKGVAVSSGAPKGSARIPRVGPLRSKGRLTWPPVRGAGSALRGVKGARGDFDRTRGGRREVPLQREAARANPPRHRIAARLGFGLNVKGLVRAAARA